MDLDVTGEQATKKEGEEALANWNEMLPESRTQFAKELFNELYLANKKLNELQEIYKDDDEGLKEALKANGFKIGGDVDPNNVSDH